MSSYYIYKKRTTATDIADVPKNGLLATLKDRAQWSHMRMDPTGLEAPTGITCTYPVNGFPAAANWTALFKPGERVRLRFINASAATYYDVRIPGLIARFCIAGT